MDFRSLVPIFGILLVMIPVAGLTLALTLRFAIRPFVETIAHAIRDVSEASDGGGRAEIQALAASVDDLQREVERLREAQTFDRALIESKTGATGTAGDRHAG